MIEMTDLVREAQEIAEHSGFGDSSYGQWYAHILGAIDKNCSGFVGGSMHDMNDTFGEMAERGLEE